MINNYLIWLDTMRQSDGLLKGFVFVCLLAATTSITLGIFAYIKNKKNLVWLFFSASFTLWVFGLGMMTISPNESVAIIFLRIHYIGATLIPPTFFHFILVNIAKDQNIKRTENLISAKILWYFIFGGFLYLSLFTEVLLEPPRPMSAFNFYTVGGKYYWLYALLFFICI